MAKSGGFEAEFEPPLSEDYLCPVCLLPFRQPMQLPCGHQFCRSCLHNYLNTKGVERRCPVDREIIDMEKVFPDKFMERKVLSLNVFCQNSQHACDWKGELRNEEKHLISCRFKPLKCANKGCHLFVPEIYMSHHALNECTHRKWVCKFCAESLLWKESKDHMTNCEHGPVICPNACGEEPILRRTLSEHIKVCPLSKQACAYSNLGCQFVGTQPDRLLHDKENVHDHLSLAVGKVTKLENELEDRKRNEESVYLRLDALEQRMNKDKKILETKVWWEEAEKKVLQEKFCILEEKVLGHVSRNSLYETDPKETVIEKEVLKPYLHEQRETEPIKKAYIVAEKQFGMHVWAVDNYRAKLGVSKITNDSIYSNHFYSANFGYKIRMAASLNGQHSGRGSHVGLRIQLMKGPYDDYLHWPFDHKITLIILHQLDESKNVSLTFHPKDLLPDAREKHFGKPVTDINPGRGKGGLLSHMNVDDDEGFIVNDTIYFMCDLHTD